MKNPKLNSEANKVINKENPKTNKREKSNKKYNHIIITYKMILIGIGLGIIYWILQAAMDVFIFHQGNFVGRILITCPKGLWMRLLVVSILAGFSVYAQVMINRTKKAEDELKEYHIHLEKLVKDRTAELEAFVYSVSHDLRAPLRAMEGFSYALLEDYASKLDSKGQEYARRILKASRRMDAIIEDLLNYSRISRAELKLKKVYLEQVLKEALARLETEIKEKNAEIKIQGPLPQVMGHYNTLIQIIVNIISNAVKFVASDVTPCVQIWAEDDKEKIKLYVEDNGIGIAIEHQERIFDPFERLHGIETYLGTGIGLAIVGKGIEKMGGNVGIESSLGKGSKFWIEMRKEK